MKIKLNLKIFIFLLIFFITNQIKIYGILMLFALIHEIGHMVVGILLGFKPVELEIIPFGVSISFNLNINNYNKKIKNGTLIDIKKIIIALAGPITNFIFIITYLMNNISFFGIERRYVVYSNILIGLFNLLPIYPLDGGRIIKSIIHIFYGLKSSYIYINKISNITVVLLTIIASIGILYLKNISILFFITYLWILVIINNKKYKNKIMILTKIEKMLDF